MGEIFEFSKWILWLIIVIVICAIIFTIVFLVIKGIAGVKNADIDRKIYEQSKSYIHGKTQDLAKYYEEFQKADEQGKQVIKNIIQMNFAELDETKIENRRLKAFLQEMRGY